MKCKLYLNKTVKKKKKLKFVEASPYFTGYITRVTS